jgi:hypothetical protein
MGLLHGSIESNGQALANKAAFGLSALARARANQEPPLVPRKT